MRWHGATWTLSTLPPSLPKKLKNKLPSYISAYLSKGSSESFGNSPTRGVGHGRRASNSTHSFFSQASSLTLMLSLTYSLNLCHYLTDCLPLTLDPSASLMHNLYEFLYFILSHLKHISLPVLISTRTLYGVANSDT